MISPLLRTKVMFTQPQIDKMSVGKGLGFFPFIRSQTLQTERLMCFFTFKRMRCPRCRRISAPFFEGKY